MLKPKTPGILPQSALGTQQSNDHHHSNLPLAPQAQAPNQKPNPPHLHKDPPILIKQASTDKARDKKKDRVSPAIVSIYVLAYILCSALWTLPSTQA